MGKPSPSDDCVMAVPLGAFFVTEQDTWFTHSCTVQDAASVLAGTMLHGRPPINTYVICSRHSANTLQEVPSF